MKLVRRATLCGKALLYVLVGLAVFAGSEPLVGAQDREPSSSARWLKIDGRADGCVSEPELLREVERILEREPHDGVRIEARTRGRGWVVELWHAAGQRAVREFPVLPDECDVRLRALALSIALAVEHAVAATGAQGFAPERLELSPASAPELSWALGVDAGASLGELPGVAAVLGLGARIELDRWVPIELRAFGDVRTSESSLAGARLTTRQLTGTVGSCVGPHAKGVWRFDFCLGVELGAVLGRAHSIAQPEPATVGSGAVNFGLAARWSPRRHLALTARLEGFGRFLQPRFVLLEADEALFAARRLPVAGGRLWLGLAWRSR